MPSIEDLIYFGNKINQQTLNRQRRREKYLTSKPKPDVVVMDYEMPVLNGTDIRVYDSGTNILVAYAQNGTLNINHSSLLITQR